MEEAKNLLINRRVWGLEEAAEELEYLVTGKSNYMGSRGKYLPQKLGLRLTATIGFLTAKVGAEAYR